MLRPIAELSDLLDDTLEQELLSDIPDFTGSFPADQLRQVTGKGKDTGKTFYRIQPYLPDGRRITLRLGSGQKQAAKAFKAIRDLIDSRKASCEPSPETKGWIENTVQEQLCLKLLKCGLIEHLPERLSGDCNTTQVTISQITDEYIATRGAGQAAASLTLYRKTKWNLIDCFGDIDIRGGQKRGRSSYSRLAFYVIIFPCLVDQGFARVVPAFTLSIVPLRV